MTFILNILHKDHVIVAADKKGVAEWPDIWGLKDTERVETNDVKKIVLNSTEEMAIGISGYSPHNSFENAFRGAKSSEEALSIVRKHMEGFLQVDDLPALIKNASPFENKSIASFYDLGSQTFFSNEFYFNEYSNGTRLHRASEQVKLFCAGSGKVYFDLENEQKNLQSLIESIAATDLSEVFMQWVIARFETVSGKDNGCGSEVLFAVSSRKSPKFQLIDSC